MSRLNWTLESNAADQPAIEVTATAVLGRAAEVDIVLGSPHVSRRHAELSLRDGKLYVRDLGSANGSFVNDRRIDAETELHDGDWLRFDTLAFQIKAPEPTFQATVLRPAITEAQLAAHIAASQTAAPAPAPAPANNTAAAPAPAPAPANNTAANTRPVSDTPRQHTTVFDTRDAVAELNARAPGKAGSTQSLATVSADTPLAELEVNLPDGSMLMESLTQQDLRLGRGPDNDFVIADGSVSGQHAIIRWQGDGWQLIDSGSRNGSFINDQRIESAALVVGDKVGFGRVTGRVQPIKTLTADSKRRDGSSTGGSGAASSNTNQSNKERNSHQRSASAGNKTALLATAALLLIAVLAASWWWFSRTPANARPTSTAASAAQASRALWTQQVASNARLLKPLLLENAVVVADANGKLSWRDLQTGVSKASHDLKARLIADIVPLANDGGVLAVTSTGHAVVFTTDGEISAELSSPRISAVHSVLPLPDGNFIVAGQSMLAAENAATGTWLWSQVLPPSVVMTAPPLLQGERIYYVDSSPQLVAVGIDGKPLWRQPLAGVVVQPVQAVNDRLLVQTATGQLQSFSLAGEPLWSQPFAATLQALQSHGDQLALRRDDGTVIGIAADSGEQRWQQTGADGDGLFSKTDTAWIWLTAQGWTSWSMTAPEQSTQQALPYQGLPQTVTSTAEHVAIGYQDGTLIVLAQDGSH